MRRSFDLFVRELRKPRFFIFMTLQKGEADMGKAISSQQLEQLQQLAERLTFGTITLTFQNGKLIQIEKSEKIRVDK